MKGVKDLGHNHIKAQGRQQRADGKKADKSTAKEDSRRGPDQEQEHGKEKDMSQNAAIASTKAQCAGKKQAGQQGEVLMHRRREQPAPNAATQAREIEHQ